MKKREVAIFLHDLKPGRPNRTKRLVVAYDGAGNALIRHKGRLVHPWTLPDFDAVLPLSDASFAVEISPPGQAVLGIESGEMLAISRNGRAYTAPIDKIYATLQRWHAKEHPTGKRRRRLFTSSEQMRKYRMEHQGGL